MILYGASGHGKVIAEILEANGIYNIVFWDDGEPTANFGQYSIVKPSINGSIDNSMIISIGNNVIRKLIAGKTTKRFNFAKAIHPNTTISKRSVIGEGSVIMPGTIVNTDVIIGKHVIINTGAVVDHDCELGDFTHVSPNSTLCGAVSIGEGTHVGANVVIIQGVKVGSWATLGAGSVVIRDVPDYAVVVGNPARVIKYNNPNK